MCLSNDVAKSTLVLVSSAEEDEAPGGEMVSLQSREIAAAGEKLALAVGDLITAGTVDLCTSTMPRPTNPGRVKVEEAQLQVPETSSSVGCRIKFLLPHPSATQVRLHPQEANLLGAALLVPRSSNKTDWKTEK